MKHHIFLSYSREDILIVNLIRDDFEKEGFTVWTDQHIKPGDSSWIKQIQKAIEDSGCVVVIMTPEAKNSEWVEKEIEYAQALDRPIIPLLARGNKATAVPVAIITSQHIDIKENRIGAIRRASNTIRELLNLPPKPEDLAGFWASNTDDYFSLQEGKTLRELWENITKDSGIIIILDEKHKLVGMISIGDLLKRLLEEDLSENTPIKRLMVPKSKIKHVKETSTMSEVHRLIANFEIDQVPVLNENDELTGVVTKSEVAAWFRKNR
ncbi:MAG: hypothetical protein BroJett018_14090 [Chloroflexota bacterium]|nr:TIR domain-containing protein [Chloroflexota bacterium]NOG62958.1 TIR domain-containing protein [Chloroflexota bacterium]GIK63615.1 MAG: hypothetical protein BroJett018_14090 [Chloroflexota bacterium]